MTFIDVLVAVVALCVVIVLHEFGHYITAVWTGMKVDRFSVFGIGPAIIRFGKWRGTEFVIGAIPFGAYVMIRGMEPEEEASPPDPADGGRPADSSSDPSDFRNRPLAARALVMAGGPLANYITAIALYFAVFAGAGLRGPIESLGVSEVAEDSAAQAAGLEVGDKLVRVGSTVIDPTKRGQDVLPAASASRGETLEVVVDRDGELLTKQVDVPQEGSPLGIMMSTQEGPRQKVPITVAAAEAIKFPFVLTGAQLSGLYKLITGQIQPDLAGPIGIVRHIAQQADAGIIPFIVTAAMISTLLGMFNLLPLPALDGGRLTFLLYEAIARRRASPRIEEMVHGYGMLALLAILVVVSVGDVRRLL